MIIVLVKDDKIISGDIEVAQTFNDFFEKAVNSLDIRENKSLLTETKDIHGGAEVAIKKFEIHPSIISINENVKVESRFSFSEVNVSDIRLEIKCLKAKKALSLDLYYFYYMAMFNNRLAFLIFPNIAKNTFFSIIALFFREYYS